MRNRPRTAARLSLALVAGFACAAPAFASTRVLRLDEAVQTARQHQPQLTEASAATAAAIAQALQARSGLLPQVTLSGSYQRTTANFVARPSIVPSQAQNASPTFQTFDFYNWGASATQLLYDFGQTSQRWRAAQATAGSERETQQATLLSVLNGARVAFFNACAAKALVGVAEQTLVNQQKHLKQIEGFVEVGTRPEIDLAQGRTDVANAKFTLVNAQGQYATSKALLNQAIGIEGTVDYDVYEETLPPVKGEDEGSQVLFEEALLVRPDLASLGQQKQAQVFTLRSIEGAYAPSISVGTNGTEAGRQIGNQSWNWNAGITLSWPIYEGGLTDAQASQTRANIASVDAQIAALRQAVLVQVQQARFAVISNRAALSAADEALTNANQQLRLAEGRYETGVGSVIELGDAQVAQTSAAGQRVQAQFNLAVARANLIQALGRE